MFKILMIGYVSLNFDRCAYRKIKAPRSASKDTCLGAIYLGEIKSEIGKAHIFQLKYPSMN